MDNILFRDNIFFVYVPVLPLSGNGIEVANSTDRKLIASTVVFKESNRKTEFL